MPSLNHLPTELLCKIFDTSAAPHRPCNCPWPVRHGNDSPAQGLIYSGTVRSTLSAVCRLWKYTVERTPSLWCHLLLDPQGTEVITDLLISLEAQIKHSGNLRLSLFVLQTYSFDWDQDFSMQMAAFLERYSDRWHRILLDIPEDVLRSNQAFQLGVSPTRFPCLEQFALSSAASGDVLLRITAEKFPRLKIIALSTIFTDSVVINWEQLTILHLDRIYISELIDAIKNTQRLVHLRANDVLHSEGGEQDGDSFSLPFLETLDIMYIDSGIDSLFFHRLQTPRLQRLRFVTAHSTPPWPKAATNKTSLGGLIGPTTPTQSSSQQGAYGPEIIIVAESSGDEETEVDFDFVQSHAPYSHILWLGFPYSSSYIMRGEKESFPCLWADWDVLCPLCFAEECGRLDKHTGSQVALACKYDRISYRLPLLGHDLETCTLCRRRGLS